MVLFNPASIHAGIWMQDASVCGGKRKPRSEGEKTVAFHHFCTTQSESSRLDDLLLCLPSTAENQSNLGGLR